MPDKARLEQIKATLAHDDQRISALRATAISESRRQGQKRCHNDDDNHHHQLNHLNDDDDDDDNGDAERRYDGILDDTRRANKAQVCAALLL